MGSICLVRFGLIIFEAQGGLGGFGFTPYGGMVMTSMDKMPDEISEYF